METNPKRPPRSYRLKCKTPDSEGWAVVPQWLSLFNISIDGFLSLLFLVPVPNVWDPSNTSWYFFFFGCTQVCAVMLRCSSAGATSAAP